MGEFEILPHTADVGFRARAATLPELFETASRAMFSLEYDPESVPLDETRAVAAGGDDLEAALCGWLSELLWLHDAERFVPGPIVVERVGGPPGDGAMIAVSGSAQGALLGDWFVQGGPQLKAVTLHGLAVTPVAGGYEATVYLDV
ncbi:MAG TPA: archease [Actinomycetota bacterium]|nr:archease [Actinomycetota bacterium]